MIINGLVISAERLTFLWHILFVTQTDWFEYIPFATIKTVEALKQADLGLLINYNFSVVQFTSCM